MPCSTALPSNKAKQKFKINFWWMTEEPHTGVPQFNCFLVKWLVATIPGAAGPWQVLHWRHRSRSPHTKLCTASSISPIQVEDLRALQVGRDTMHDKKGHGAHELLPLVAGPIAGLLLAGVKVAAEYMLWATPTLGVYPMPSASAHMGSTSKSKSQNLSSSTAASSSPASPSHCFFLLKSWQTSWMLIKQHWALAQPVTVLVLIQILDTPCSISGCLLDGQLARHTKSGAWA